MILFDVALWRVWPSLFPEWTGTLQAPNAYSALVQVMQVYGLQDCAWGQANARDGSIRYSCIGLSGVSRGPIWMARPGPRLQRKKVEL
jgi:hypothetical protein